MELKIVEVHNVNRFLEEEVPKSIGIIYPPGKIKGFFTIKPKDGIWRTREKE